MILSTVSIDPRRILEAHIDQVGKQYRINIELLYGQSVKVSEVFCDTLAEAQALMKKLDKVAYKHQLADAIASDRLDDDDNEEEEGKLGFV